MKMSSVLLDSILLNLTWWKSNDKIFNGALGTLEPSNDLIQDMLAPFPHIHCHESCS